MEDRKELEVRSEINVFTDDAMVRRLLWHCVGRLALRDRNRDTAISFRRDRHKIMHITDWLTADVLREADWLGRTDDAGIPKKLLKFGSLDAICAEADRAMALAARNQPRGQLSENDIAVLQELEEGFRVVRLLTPAALDDESRRLAHCVGNGAYDNMLASGKREYLSLRDSDGNAYATMEVASSYLLQLQGRANTLPDRRYLDLLQPFFKANDISLGETPAELGFLFDDKGVIHTLDRLPDGLTVDDDTDLSGERFPVVLPRSLTVWGKLEIIGLGLTELPSGMTVGEYLDISYNPIRALPDDLQVSGDIIADEVPLEYVPDHLAGKLKTGDGKRLPRP